MKALLVIDVQNAIVEFKDFRQELKNIENIIKDFKEKGESVIFIRNIEDEETSSFFKESPSSALHPSLKEYADFIIEKKTPSVFSRLNFKINWKSWVLTNFSSQDLIQNFAVSSLQLQHMIEDTRLLSLKMPQGRSMTKIHMK